MRRPTARASSRRRTRGTIFLDEIGELEPLAQVKLLRVLETGELQRVGSDKFKQVDVRVIAATNRNLEAMVREGRFREDLYYRLNMCPIHLPSLRERRDEIGILLEYFLEEACAKQNKSVPRSMRSCATTFARSTTIAAISAS